MQKREVLKRLLLLLMLFSLLFAALPALAQEGDAEGSEADTTEAAEETAAEEEEHGEEEGGSPLDPLGINPGFLFVQIFNFLILLVVVTLFLWRPAMNMLDARSTEIEKGLEDAAAAAKARQNAEAEADKIMQDARAKVAKEMEEARTRGGEVAKSIEQEARQEADKIMQDARADAAAARDAALSDLREQVLNISMAVSQRILRENLDEKKQKQLVDDFFTNLPAEAKSLTGKVEVVSAMPLSDAEKKKTQGELNADEVTFTVNPNILGGLIVRSGDRVIDGSVRGSLGELAGRLA